MSATTIETRANLKCCFIIILPSILRTVKAVYYSKQLVKCLLAYRYPRHLKRNHPAMPNYLILALQSENHQARVISSDITSLIRDPDVDRITRSIAPPVICYKVSGPQGKFGMGLSTGRSCNILPS